jgi:hypothetical protein
VLSRVEIIDVRSISAARQLMQKDITIDAYFAKQISLFGTCCLLPVLELQELHPDFVVLRLRESLFP